MGNMFRCVLASGTGNGIPLIVTCTSAFAGLTITCTDGTTTLTDTCPSSSPYEITFNLPNTGTWTVSGTISGDTFSESILIQDFDIELNNYIDISVDFYSAANDTVSYPGVDEQTHTITTDSSGHASATITIKSSGSTLTFTSSVAKNPSDLSNYYSKAITLTKNTTSVYVMPDNVLYWWGYKNNLEDLSSVNGWTPPSNYAFIAPVYNTNNIYMAKTSESKKMTGVGNINTLLLSNATIKAIVESVDMTSNAAMVIDALSAKNYVTSRDANVSQSVLNTVEVISISQTSVSYVACEKVNANGGYLYALWVE